MTALIIGGISGWVTLRVCGFRLRWPWRVLDLSLPPVQGRAGSHRRSPRSRNDLSRRRNRPFRRTASSGPVLADERLVEASLPGAVDLLRVAVSAGHSLHGAIGAVGEGSSGPVSKAFAQARHRFDNGASLVDEVARLPLYLGPSARPLSTTLVVAMSSGAPLANTLQRLADSERRRLRRRTEERVRRLPLLLLAPLIGLVLPAFVVLTVVPVVLATADSSLTTGADSAVGVRAPSGLQKSRPEWPAPTENE